MLETPDAPPGDVEDGAVTGPDDSRSAAPLNPVGRTFAEVEDEDLPVLEEPRAVFFDQYGDADEDEPAFVAVDPPSAPVEDELEDAPNAGAEPAAVEVPAAVAEEASVETPAATAARPDAGAAKATAEESAVAQPAGEEAVCRPEAVADVEVVAAEAPEAVPAEEPQEPEPAPQPTVSELQAELAALTASLATTQRRADELMVVARRQTEMADELHAENRRLREGEIREAVAPLVRGLARLADDLARMRAGADPAAGADLAYLDGQVGELLHDAGVNPLQAEVGEPFDPQCHQATGSATTDITALHRTIAEVRRSGLRRDDGRMLRPVDVVVFRYVAPAPPPADDTPATEEVT